MMSATGSVTEPPPTPPFPPDAQAVMWMRQAAGRPPLQPLIMFLNQDRTLCYSNAGTNFLLSPPALVEFLLRLPPCEGIPRRFRQLALTSPLQVSLTLKQRNNCTVTAKEHTSNQRKNRRGCTSSQRLLDRRNPSRCPRVGCDIQGGYW